MLLLLILLLGGGVYIGFFEKSIGGHIFRSIRWIFGLAAIVIGGWIGISENEVKGIVWERFEYKLLEEA